MYMKHRFIRNLTICLSAMAISSAASAQDEQQPPLRIGMTVSSTGTFALASQSGVRGIEVWVDDVNRRGGIEIDGKQRLVELVKRDDRSDKQMVTRVYEGLISDEKVDLVFAPFGSTLTAAAATVTERMDKFLMIWSASSDQLYAQGFKNIVSGTQMPASLQLALPFEYAKTLGVEKVAIIYSDEPFPTALAAGGKEQAEKNGIEVVMYERYPKGQKDFSTVLQKARIAGADAFFPTSYEGDLISIARQMKQLNISFPFSFMFYASTPQFQAIGSDGDYVFSNTNYGPSINWKVNAGLNRNEFAAEYDRLFPNAEFAPDFQTALAYGAGVVTEEIIKKAQSTDAEKMKQAALDLSGKLTVMAGPYEINEEGVQLKMPFPVVQLQPEKGMVTLYPEEVATGEVVYPIPAWDER